jgi:hypothetical protein
MGTGSSSDSSLCCNDVIFWRSLRLTSALDGVACDEAASFLQWLDTVSNSGTFCGSKQSHKRFVHWFSAKMEGVVVHGNHDLSCGIQETAQGFLRAHVDAAIAVWVISSDRQECDIRA